MSEHIDDLELSEYTFDPDSIAPERRTEIQRHTEKCAECGARLDFYFVAEDDLRDPEVWGESTAQMPASLRDEAYRCAVEDAEADVLLRPYFANPAKAMWANLPKQREFLTGGVVRRLNARADKLHRSEPLTALIFADLAQAISDLLPDSLYPGNAVFELRAVAWKQRANALLFLARYDDALEALRSAERAYRKLPSFTHGLAAVELVRASVYYQVEDLEEADTHAQLAEKSYGYLGQERKCTAARYLRGSIKYLAHDLGGASAIFQKVIEFGENASDVEWIAKGSYARANCELDRGNAAEASLLFHTALVIFRETGPAVDRICAEWGLARVVLHGGRADDAAGRLRAVIDELEERGMVMEAAVAGLDLADAHLVLQQPRHVARIAAHSYRVLKEAGVVTSALTALAYLEEAATNGRVNRNLIQNVRTFLRRTERQPDLIFLIPPDGVG
jgi:tetratricopeptide (TPR) repeat protein